MEIALLSEQLFKDNSPIKDETTIKKFVPFVLIAQKLKIKNLLGLALYTELQTQILDDGLTHGNKALILEIAPALSFWALYFGLPFHWAQVQDKGLTVQKSDNSSSVSKDDMSSVRVELETFADLFTKDLQNYLQKCGQNYPTYRPPIVDCELKNNTTNGAISSTKTKKHDGY